MHEVILLNEILYKARRKAPIKAIIPNPIPRIVGKDTPASGSAAFVGVGVVVVLPVGVGVAVAVAVGVGVKLVVGVGVEVTPA